MDTESCVLFICDFENSFHFGCKSCRKIISEGKRFAVGLLIGGMHQYLLGPDPPVMCCGEKKLVWLTFPTQEEADQAAEQVRRTLNRDLSTEQLNLIGWVVVPRAPRAVG